VAGLGKCTSQIPCCQGLWPNGVRGWAGGAHHPALVTQRFKADVVPAATRRNYSQVTGQAEAMFAPGAAFLVLTSRPAFARR
jgi:hypothetical protein